MFHLKIGGDTLKRQHMSRFRKRDAMVTVERVSLFNNVRHDPPEFPVNLSQNLGVIHFVNSRPAIPAPLDEGSCNTSSVRGNARNVSDAPFIENFLRLSRDGFIRSLNDCASLNKTSILFRNLVFYGGGNQEIYG